MIALGKAKSDSYHAMAALALVGFAVLAVDCVADELAAVTTALLSVYAPRCACRGNFLATPAR